MGCAAIAPAQAQNDADKNAIRAVALDYIEGWYTGNAERMERALHPELAKRIVRRDARTRESLLGQQSAMTLVQNTRASGGKQTPEAKRLKEVIVLDVFENAASVKVIAADWVDYLHIARWNGTWKIINVLWEMKPEESR